MLESIQDLNEISNECELRWKIVSEMGRCHVTQTYVILLNNDTINYQSNGPKWIGVVKSYTIDSPPEIGQ